VVSPERVLVHVSAPDPVSQAVLWSQLRAHPALIAVDDASEADVVVVVTEVIDPNALARIRALAMVERARVVLIATQLDQRGALAAVDAGVHSILHRSDADSERLAAAVVLAAGGDVALPSDVLGLLLARLDRPDTESSSTVVPIASRWRGTSNGSRIHSMSNRWQGTVAGADTSADTDDAEDAAEVDGFTERELTVLRLVSEGFDTAEIAAELAYSERTVKNAIHAVTERHNLRNRSHAVAYALRVGAI
jgi:DNA-binding NarL/FixJ family response regulator